MSVYGVAAMRHARFVIIILAICLGGYAGLLGLGRSSFYCSHTHSFFDTAPCFQPEVRGQQADVLLVGDSSLLYGINPRLVQAAGGGSTYNLGMVGPSFGFRVGKLIDRYLANNARPKAIILYFAPWHLLSGNRVTDPQWAPLGIYLLRHGGIDDIAAYLRVNPSAIVELPPLLWNGMTQSGARTSVFRKELALNHGYLNYDRRGTLRPLPDDCSPSTYDHRGMDVPDNRAALAALRQQYRARGIPLFVYIAPTAICDAQVAAVRQAYAGSADMIPQALPNRLFANDTTRAEHVHASPEGVAVFSNNLAAFIRAVVQPKLGSSAP